MKKKFILFKVSVVALTWTLAISSANAGQFRVISWNLESGDNRTATIVDQIGAFSGYDIWGLSEVHATNADRYAQAAAVGETGQFEAVLGTTGRADRLMIIYNNSRFELVSSEELDEINIGGDARATLVARLRERATSTEFLFMVNHLHRSRAERRQEQAKILREFAADQTIPVIAVGNYNFDFDIPSGTGNTAFDLMLQGNTFNWVRPATLIKTHASDKYNRLLDFVFTSGDATGWNPVSTIIVRPNDFPDTRDTSDHRPVEAVFQTYGVREQIFERIAVLVSIV